jgi:hypothetical protein
MQQDLFLRLRFLGPRFFALFAFVLSIVCHSAMNVPCSRNRLDGVTGVHAFFHMVLKRLDLPHHLSVFALKLVPWSLDTIQVAFQFSSASF